MSENEDEDYKKGLYIFGRDVSKIPCFRNSYLYGIGTGFAGGLTTFFFTSRPKFATNVAVGCFTVVTLCYWTQCRYKFSETKFKYAQIKAGMQAAVELEGTDIEKQVMKDVEHKA